MVGAHCQQVPPQFFFCQVFPASYVPFVFIWLSSSSSSYARWRCLLPSRRRLSSAPPGCHTACPSEALDPAMYHDRHLTLFITASSAWWLRQTCLPLQFWRRIYVFRTVCTLVRVDLSKLRFLGGQVNICELIVLGPM